jgi:phosphatidylcholine synthase
MILCFSQLTNLKFPHLVRVEFLRKLTLPFGAIYIGNLFYLSWTYSNETGINDLVVSKVIMLSFPIYIAAISLWRTFKNDGASSELSDSE